MNREELIEELSFEIYANHTSPKAVKLAKEFYDRIVAVEAPRIRDEVLRETLGTRPAGCLGCTWYRFSHCDGYHCACPPYCPEWREGKNEAELYETCPLPAKEEPRVGEQIDQRGV